MVTAVELIKRVEIHVKGYMWNLDPSHDFHHVKRVVSRAHIIYEKMMAVQDVSTPLPHYDITAITLSALLHDVGDRKYLKPGQDSETMIRTLLLGFGADVALATKVQAICSNVSFFEEMKSAEAKQQVQEVIKEHPELTIVQDADRIDSLGAIGIGRVFAYGGAKEPHMSMLDAMNIFNWKLLKVEGEMKTQPGTEMAREATARLEEFKRWWEEEVAIENNYRLTITM